MNTHRQTSVLTYPGGISTSPHPRLSSSSSPTPSTQSRGDGLSQNLLSASQEAVLSSLLAALDGSCHMLLTTMHVLREEEEEETLTISQSHTKSLKNTKCIYVHYTLVPRVYAQCIYQCTVHNLHSHSTYTIPDICSARRSVTSSFHMPSTGEHRHTDRQTDRTDRHTRILQRS